MINSIRSSLDLLVNRLAERARYSGKEDAHFPICRDRDAFFKGKRAGRKAIKRLSTDDHRIIEELEPWAGGQDPLLYVLHDLDVTRKHRLLVVVTPRIQSAQFTTTGERRSVSLKPVDAIAFQNDAELGIFGIEADNDQIELGFDVRLDEAGPLAGEDITPAIQRLAATAAQRRSTMSHRHFPSSLRAGTTLRSACPGRPISLFFWIASPLAVLLGRDEKWHSAHRDAREAGPQIECASITQCKNRLLH